MKPTLDDAELKALEKEIRSSVRRVRKIARGEIQHIAWEAKQIMREEAPLGATEPGRDYSRAPHLRDTITYSMNARSIEAVVGPQVPHSHLVEFGTVRMAPNPFVGRTLERIQPVIDDAIERVLDTNPW
jgi:HK97 gp10 family phage protein